MKFVAILAIFAILVVAVSAAKVQPIPEELSRAVYEAWKLQHSKAYASDVEDAHRFNVFKANLDFIRQHNASNKGFTVKMNMFGDLTNDEYRQFLGLSKRPVTSGNAVHKATVAAPDSVDWRTKNAVTPVKNQGQCGSCWSFSTTGALEGGWVLQANHALVSLSEQELVDCSGSYGNQGCNGGLMDDAFKYVKDHGLSAEADYKYTARDGTCKKNVPRAIPAGALKGFTDITPNSDSDFQNALGTVGPVSVAIYAAGMSFQFYSHGVYKDAACKNDPNDLDHGVLAVGYAASGAEPYYIVKNSWGGSWGNEGYIWMLRGANVNQCGILDSASIPNF